MNHYILHNREAVPADLMTWARWHEKADRIVAKDNIGKSLVSTVFLGINHSFGSGPPMLFETMVFGGDLDGEQERCTTCKQAEAQHAVMCIKVAASMFVGG